MQWRQRVTQLINAHITVLCWSVYPGLRIYQSKKYNLKNWVRQKKFSLHSQFSHLYFYIICIQQNIIFSPIINYWATFVAQRLKKQPTKLQQTHKNLPKKRWIGRVDGCLAKTLDQSLISVGVRKCCVYHLYNTCMSLHRVQLIGHVNHTILKVRGTDLLDWH